MRTPRAFSVWWAGLIVACAAVSTVSPAFAQPTAVNDFFSTSQATMLTVPANVGVLSNDTGVVGGEALQAVLVSNPSNGILVLGLGANGGFLYIPHPGFIGDDSFTYQASQGGLLSNVAIATISVTTTGGGINVPPVANGDSYSINEDQTLNVAAAGVLANDTDSDAHALTAVLIDPIGSGTLALQPNGSFSYTPPPNFNGAISFTYQADDGAARSNTATVAITVTAVNDAPSAQPDSYTVAEDSPLTVGGTGVLGNDTDPEGDALRAEVVRNVPTANGTLALNETGTFGYAPADDFNGTTSFTYRARDAAAQSGEVTVTINVTPVNDPPFRTNTAEPTVREGETYRYELAATDPDRTTPTISAPTLPRWLAFTAPNTISGTPADADVGVHGVTMSFTDGTAPAVTYQFQITVENVDNRPSIATIPEQTATENTAFDLDLSAFVTDTDTDKALLTYAAISGVPPGLSLSAAGRLSGTPLIGASVGTHIVRFTVADASNNPPVAGQFRLVVLPAGRVDLAVAMRASPSPVTLDAPATWTITVTNRAPQVEAQGASLTGTFAGEVPFRFDAPPSNCTLTPSGDQSSLACTIGRLAGGASTIVTLTGRGSFAGDVFADAKVAVVGAALDETNDNDSTTASLSIAQRVSATPAQRVELPNGRAAAAGDFNGDGFDDLVVATASPLGVVLFTNVADPLNPGRRAFATPPQTIGGEALSTDVAVVDLDRDGDLDIVTAAGSGAPDRVFVNAGGTFNSTALGNPTVESRAVAAADINGDAFVDLVFAGASTSTVFMNTGSGGTFTPGATVGPHDARDVLLVDLFGDTLPELVLANAVGGATVYRNTRGAFRLEPTLATGATSAVASGDFNADGRADLVFGRDTAALPAVPSDVVLLSTPGASGQFFVSDELGAAETTALLVRDFNVDTRSDVLALNGNGVRIFTNAGAANGTFALHPQQLATPRARAAAAGKFNNDDRVDLAVVGDEVALFVNDGAGNFGQPDANAPVLQLRGDATVNLVIDSPFVDPGATATDQEDGDITSRIAVSNPVNTALLGTYTVTYTVSDLAGNAAAPVRRTVNIQPQPAASEGGGGALGLEALAALLLAAALSASQRRRRRNTGLPLG